jgi:predicted protein tyrosine phosphatase
VSGGPSKIGEKLAKIRILFVCTANIARSRAAEKLLVDSCKYEAKSAGFIMLDERSGQLVTQELIDWANIIIVMDEKNDCHLTRLIDGFKLRNKVAVVLGIPDTYRPDDPALVVLLEQKLSLIGILADSS